LRTLNNEPEIRKLAAKSGFELVQCRLEENDDAS
jgi:hypothetical protein